MILFSYNTYFCKFHCFSFLDNWVTFPCAYMSCSPYPVIIEGQLGWLHSHAIVNRTAEHMGVWVSQWQIQYFGRSSGVGKLGHTLVTSSPLWRTCPPSLISIVAALVNTLPAVDTSSHSAAFPASTCQLFPWSQPFYWSEKESQSAFEFFWHK